MFFRYVNRIAVAFIAIVMFPMLLECTTTCQIGKQNDVVGGSCPVKVTPVRSHSSGGTYSECVTVRVWIRDSDFRHLRPNFLKTPAIEIVSSGKDIIIRPKRKETKKKPHRRFTQVICDSSHSNNSVALWELVHDCCGVSNCVKAEVGHVISVSYQTKSTSCRVDYTVPDPKPDFVLSVDRPSKSINVTVEPGDHVYARWCHMSSGGDCMGGQQITIDSSRSRSGLLNVSNLLPCVCVQVYYTHTDALRRNQCPFRNQSLDDVMEDVWLFSAVELYESRFIWSSQCPVRDLQLSASLCWKQQQHAQRCTPVINSTLQGDQHGSNMNYDTSAVDKHPQMCVQFSLHGSHDISCPFETDMSSWDVSMGSGGQSVPVYLTSLVPAQFSAQICVLNETGCTPIGQVHSATVEGNFSAAEINLPRNFLSPELCVQVWQSDPALNGRRILCPDYSHKRSGLFAVAALILVFAVASLGTFLHRLTKNGTAGWLCIQKPVLVVCSSDHSSHVSAVCALASLLQAELKATVHTALWAHSSPSKAEDGLQPGTAVGDLGPIPWLYGKWETVRNAQGKVLIIWSPEAKKTYEKWREEQANLVNNEKRKEKEDFSRVEVKLNGRRLVKCKKQKSVDDIDLGSQKKKEPSAVIAPVFMGALACLHAALQGCKGQGVALVYFQGLCHSRDVPKALRGVPRYCLPQDFRGLIQELGGTSSTRTENMGKFRWHCWPRLLSKVMSVWLARQLAQRLQKLLPSPQRTMRSGHRRDRFKLPKVAKKSRSGSAQEHKPLHGPPQRAERLLSPLSRV